ncbi:ROK family transcriptional regulator [Nakamurella endophytica]|uniref:Sugar kinase n=1 Tax=Nakamurella endophytica TaxID=1748367 RepID=A0A917TDP1_9ACTN|nr:ROK family protein [Nakamurella endophytica]GGM18906.1 sugar kinase [Nakamurella endophytica]
MGSLWTEVGLLKDDRNLTPDAYTARSVIARFVADRSVSSRTEVVTFTGLARSTVDKHLQALIDSGLVEGAGVGRKDPRGRPAQFFQISARRGVLLVADVSVGRCRVALTTLTKSVVARSEFAIDVAAGPREVLSALCARLSDLLQENDLTERNALAVSVGLPGPVDSHRGFAVRPPLMPGWDGFDVCGYLAAHFRCDVLVDNDVNLAALGEARALKGACLPLLMINIGTGVGGGFVSESGLLLHGADGAATDIGHTQVRSKEDILCRCGARGCLEAVASVGAMARRLSELAGRDVSIAELFDGLQRGDAMTVSVVREAAILVGHVVADLVNFCNPARIVIGGSITHCTDDILAQIRSVVYQRSQPLATRNLSIVRGGLGNEAGLIGGMIYAIEQVLSPRGIQYHTRGSELELRPLGLRE